MTSNTDLAAVKPKQPSLSASDSSTLFGLIGRAEAPCNNPLVHQGAESHPGKVNSSFEPSPLMWCQGGDVTANEQLDIHRENPIGGSFISITK